MKIQASHGDVYDIPEVLERLFCSMDETFADVGVGPLSGQVYDAWVVLFEPYNVTGNYK